MRAMTSPTYGFAQVQWPVVWIPVIFVYICTAGRDGFSKSNIISTGTKGKGRMNCLCLFAVTHYTFQMELLQREDTISKMCQHRF